MTNLAYTFDLYGFYAGAVPESQAYSNWTPIAPPTTALAEGEKWWWDPVAEQWSAKTDTASPLPVAATQPASLTPLQFVALILSTANISYATLGTTITSNATMQGLWAMLQLATSISYGDALTTAALAELVTLNVLTAAQVTAINAAWPVA
jgi:hypothetical protein